MSFRTWARALLAVAGVVTLGGYGPCVPVEPDEPVCAADLDCPAGRICRDGVCVDEPVEGERCRDMGGTCAYFLDECPQGTFDWTTLDCPLGRSGKCCLPADASCEGDLGGTCEWWQATCPEGTGGAIPLDCPDGRSAQCCIPLL